MLVPQLHQPILLYDAHADPVLLLVGGVEHELGALPAHHALEVRPDHVPTRERVAERLRLGVHAGRRRARVVIVIDIARVIVIVIARVIVIDIVIVVLVLVLVGGEIGADKRTRRALRGASVGVDVHRVHRVDHDSIVVVGVRIVVIRIVVIRIVVVDRLLHLAVRQPRAARLHPVVLDGLLHHHPLLHRERRVPRVRATPGFRPVYVHLDAGAPARDGDDDVAALRPSHHRVPRVHGDNLEPQAAADGRREDPLPEVGIRLRASHGVDAAGVPLAERAPALAQQPDSEVPRARASHADGDRGVRALLRVLRHPPVAPARTTRRPGVVRSGRGGDDDARRARNGARSERRSERDERVAAPLTRRRRRSHR